MEFLIFFWAMCAIASAVIANSKGRSGFAWFLLGFIFGIFGLIMVCAMPALRRKEA